MLNTCKNETDGALMKGIQICSQDLELNAIGRISVKRLQLGWPWTVPQAVNRGRTPDGATYVPLQIDLVPRKSVLSMSITNRCASISSTGSGRTLLAARALPASVRTNFETKATQESPTGLGRAAQKPAWLVERAGFETPSPVDFTRMDPCIKPSGNELVADYA
jgi:hypothetical protein